MVNLASPPSTHLVELQLNLAGLVDIKDGGEHAGFAVGRVFQACEPSATACTGLATPGSAWDVGSGLIKKATIAGIEGNETEGALAKALGSRAVQLAGLKILSVPFSKRHAEPAWSKSTALFWGQDLYGWVGLV